MIRGISALEFSWDEAQTFLAVAEAGSFSAAARVLALGQPTISRRIALLEERLGCQLFRRGKRGAELTVDGERLLPAAEQMARWAAEFDRAARGSEAAPEGTVRIAAPPGAAVELLAPFAKRLRERQPGIRLEILSSIEHVDLTRGVADLAVRTRAPSEPGLVSLHRVGFDMGVFAAPETAAAIPAGVALGELDWVTWAAPLEHLPPRPFLESAIVGFAPVFASDSYLVQKSAVAAGLGVMILERAQHPHAHAPALVEVPLDLAFPRGEFHLVCATSMQVVPRVRAVADAILGEIAHWLGVGADGAAPAGR